MNRKNYLLNIIITFLILLSFIKIGMIANNILILFLGIIIFNFINKSYKLKKGIKLKRWLIFLSLFFSTSYIVGDTIKTYMYNYEINIISEIFRVENIIPFIGLSFFFYYILSYLYHFLINLNFNKKDNYNHKKLFILFTIIILIGYSIYFLTHFPGILSSDSLDSIRQVLGTRNWHDHHPIFYTLFIKLFYEIGHFFFHSINGGIAFASIAQMTILALIFSKTLIFLYKRSIPIEIIILFLMFYALSPIIGFYSVTMWKDVLFGGVFALFVMRIYNLCENYEHNKAKDYLKFIFIAVIFNLLRNNAIYIFILLIPFLLYYFRKQIKQCIISVLSVIIIFYTAKYSIFNLLNVTRSSSTEYISIPLQQVARIVIKDGKISSEERNTINKLIDINTIKIVYTPYTVDNIKFNSDYHNEVFDQNKLLYLKTWKNLVFNNFDIAVESYLCSTTGFWSPTFYYDSIHRYKDDNEFGYEYSNIIFDLVNKYTDKVSSIDTPILSLQHSIVLYFWICLVFIGIVIIKKEKRYILCYIPVFGLWFTLLVATPVNSEFRYIFGVVISMPLLISIPYMKRN